MLGTAISMVATVGYLLRVKDQNTNLAGLTTAQAVAEQIATLRSFYASEVVPRAKENGLKVNYDFEHGRDTLPLPATLVNVLGEHIERDYPGTKIRLYSDHPFPHRVELMKKAGAWNENGFQNGQDDFERVAFAALKANPGQPFYRLEEVDGRLSMRYAMSDTMRPACVGCHNSHAESPKKDWKEGELRGAVSVVVPVDKAEAGLMRGAMFTALFVAIGATLLAFAVIAVISRWVLRPVENFEKTFTNIAMGDFDARVPVASDDEVGRMSSNFNAMLDNVVAPLLKGDSEKDNK